MSITKRALGALAAGALALPFIASPAVASHGPTIPTPRPIDTFCINAGALTFTDVVASGDANATELALAIRCLNTAITTTANNSEGSVIARGNPGTPQQPQGIGADKYGPQLNVTRGQMASFIARMIDAAEVRELLGDPVKALPAPAAANPFPGDVPNNYVHLDNIKRLSQAGIVNGNPGTAQQPQGIGANRFGPDLPITRSQMASFINRAVAYLSGGNPDNAGTSGNGFSTTTTNFYVDAYQEVHRANVNAITAARIANGVGGERYDGLGNVTRQQMARFIARTLATLNVPDGGQRITTLREVFSANFSDADRQTATRLAAPAGATPVAGSTREFRADGLANGVEYRITLVNAGQVTRATASNNEVRFVPGAAAGSNFLVNRGTVTADIVLVNGATPVNNDQAGGATTPNNLTNSFTAIAEPVNGTITFTIEGEEVENVIAVIYYNGGGDQTSYQTGGGAFAPLEVDNLGRPVEFFGVTGETRFVRR